MEKNKTSKYFKYAIGEIILVVIGILIALQINNWNEKRLETVKIHAYYERLVEELDLQSESCASMIKGNTEMLNMQRRTLEILATRNSDDIPELKENIGAVAALGGTGFSMDIFEEFVAQGLLAKVKDPKLKASFRNLKKALDYDEIMEERNFQQYSTLIEPFFAKNINFSKVVLKRVNRGLLTGGPETEFISLFDSMEAWNIITFKLKTTNQRNRRLEIMQNVIKTLKADLIEELARQ
ncbi:MAG: hypothetical protein KJO52_06430 [Maribacter sp.]|nr:hypothetical protein [Maribacter sp.]NNK19091.1 hypothetical protein [Maribacter sp.]